MLIRERVHGFCNKVFRSKGSLWVPLLDLVVPKHHNILSIVEGPRGKFLYAGHNIVTDAGDQYYAQSALGETPTNAFANLYLSTVAWGAPGKTSNSSGLASVISGSEKAPTATYPKTNDGDSDNTGAGIDVMSWLYSYTKADFNDPSIEGGAISIASVPAWGSGTTPMLTAFNQTAFEKTSNDTLKQFLNHQQNGV